MYILFDIGGTKMRIASSADGDNFDDARIVSTPKKFNEAILLFKKIAFELTKGKQIKACAGGVAGPLNKNKAKLTNAPNLPDWAEKPLKKELEKSLSTKVFIENDSAVVGLGEAIYGAGKGHSIVTYITVSTGVGGARIIDGKIDKSAMGFEPGHQVIDAGGMLCFSCNIPGHLEGYIGGKAMEMHFNKKPSEITDQEIWDGQAQFLAYGLNNTIVHWSPDIIVLGGSMITKKPGIDIEKVSFYLKDILKIFPEAPKIKKAQLEDVGGLYGALELIRTSNIF